MVNNCEKYAYLTTTVWKGPARMTARPHLPVWWFCAPSGKHHGTGIATVDCWHNQNYPAKFEKEHNFHYCGNQNYSAKFKEVHNVNYSGNQNYPATH